MRVVLIFNDGYFAHLLARPLIGDGGIAIAGGVSSVRTKGSRKRLARIGRMAHPSFLLYRALVECVSRMRAFRGVGGIERQLRHVGMSCSRSHDINNNLAEIAALRCDLAITFNLDQVLSDQFLRLFPKGVLNCHASRLPFDKGISPALWAFARGDESLWYSIYRMSGELDCGDVLFQDRIPVFFGESAFSAYKRLCQKAGGAIVDTVRAIEAGETKVLLQSRSDSGNYFGLPDARFRRMLKRSGRSLWRVSDLIKALFE